MFLRVSKPYNTVGRITCLCKQGFVFQADPDLPDMERWDIMLNVFSILSITFLCCSSTSFFPQNKHLDIWPSLSTMVVCSIVNFLAMLIFIWVNIFDIFLNLFWFSTFSSNLRCCCCSVVSIRLRGLYSWQSGNKYRRQNSITIILIVGRSVPCRIYKTYL